MSERSNAVRKRQPASSWFGRVLAAIALLLSAASALANDRVALLIGNKEYSESTARLTNPGNDARDLADLLGKLGFRVILREDASLDVMKEAVREFSSALEKANVAVFFYAGHAMQFQANNYLLPVNAQLRNERDILLDGFDVGNVLFLMGSAKTKNIVILDACRDNPFKDRFRTGAGLAQMVAPPDTLIAYSTAPGAVAYDGAGRNSVYTKHLLRYLATPNEDVLRLFSNVGEAVQRETRSAKQPQVPWLLSSLKGQFAFNTNHSAPAGVAVAPPPAAEPTADTQLNAERVFWESLTKTSVPELELYLERFPGGLYAAIAKARIESLKARAAGAKPAVVAAAEPAARTGAPARADPPPALKVEAVAPTRPAVPASQPSGSPRAGSPADSTADVINRALAEGKLPGSPMAVAMATPAVEAASSGAAPAPAASTPVAAAAASQSRSVSAGPAPERIEYADGSLYIGSIDGRAAHGTGEYRAKDGYRYVGAFDQGKRKGAGEANWPSGDFYKGEFADDQPHGSGVYKFASGDIYEGEFDRGVASGKGIYRYIRGDIYEGMHAKGTPNGAGVIRFAAGGQYEGNFLNGAAHGAGKYQFASGDVYEGNHLNGQPHGRGKIRLASGDVYEGEFRDGHQSGKGVYTYSTGLKLEGQFLAGKAHGPGIMTFRNGSRFEGNFVGGADNATGVSIDPTGARRPARIVNGQVRPD